MIKDQSWIVKGALGLMTHCHPLAMTYKGLLQWQLFLSTKTVGILFPR